MIEDMDLISFDDTEEIVPNSGTSAFDFGFDQIQEAARKLITETNILELNATFDPLIAGNDATKHIMQDTTRVYSKVNDYIAPRNNDDASIKYQFKPPGLARLDQKPLWISSETENRNYLPIFMDVSNSGMYGPIGSQLPTSPTSSTTSRHESTNSITINTQESKKPKVSGRLHVSNIPFKYRREHLVQLFNIFGNVYDAEIIFNERGSKGFGFVSFCDVNDAIKAKQHLDGYWLEGRQIEVNIATPKPIKPTCKPRIARCIRVGV